MAGDGALHHWLQYGAREGRAGDSFFGREQPSHSLVGFRPVTQAIDQVGDHDWFQFATTGGHFITFQGNSSGVNFRIELYDSAGHLLTTGQSNISLFVPPMNYNFTTAGDYFISIVPLDTTTGNYTLTMFG